MSTEELLMLLQQLETDLGVALFEIRTHLRHSDEMRDTVNTTRIARIKSFIASLIIPDTSTWTG